MSSRKIENPELFRANIRKKFNDILKIEKNSNNLENKFQEINNLNIKVSSLED